MGRSAVPQEQLIAMDPSRTGLRVFCFGGFGTILPGISGNGWVSHVFVHVFPFFSCFCPFWKTAKFCRFFRGLPQANFDFDLLIDLLCRLIWSLFWNVLNMGTKIGTNDLFLSDRSQRSCQAVFLCRDSMAGGPSVATLSQQSFQMNLTLRASSNIFQKRYQYQWSIVYNLQSIFSRHEVSHLLWTESMIFNTNIDAVYCWLTDLPTPPAGTGLEADWRFAESEAWKKTAYVWWI